MSSQNTLCNLMIEDSDLKKLEDLDPFQTQGFQTMARTSVPVKIIYTDQTGKKTLDTQTLTFQILCRWLKSSQKKQQASLDSLRILLTSQEDIFLSFICNCSSAVFDSIKSKNQLNLHFNSFPNMFAKFLKDANLSQHTNNNQHTHQIELRLSYQGTGRLIVIENTDYKKLQLIQLFFQASNSQKIHQSIIYRYNFNKTKLSMLQNSIQTVYKLLAQKNPPLLHYIQKTVGIDA